MRAAICTYYFEHTDYVRYGISVSPCCGVCVRVFFTAKSYIYMSTHGHPEHPVPALMLPPSKRDASSVKSDTTSYRKESVIGGRKRKRTRHARTKSIPSRVAHSLALPSLIVLLGAAGPFAPGKRGPPPLSPLR